MIYEASKDDLILASCMAISIKNPDAEEEKMLLEFTKVMASILFTDNGRKRMYEVKNYIKEAQNGDYQN